MNSTLRSSQPIQIIGTQRSGSNLLRVMLNEHEQIVAPHPPHILKTFMPLLSLYTQNSGKDKFRTMVEDVCRVIETNPVQWENVHFDRDKVIARCENDSLLQIFRAVYEIMAESNSGKFWCCKSMDNAYYADQLESEGIRPIYIHLIRDGRDVASSFKKVAVGDKHIYHLASKWKDDQIISAEIVKRIGPNRAITIKYEELIENPEMVLKSICQLLSINFSKQMLNYFKSSEGLHTAASGFMWHNLTEPILKNNTKKFESELSEYEIAIFENVAGNTLKEFGYSLKHESIKLQFTEKLISEFNEINEDLKRRIKTEEYLKLDMDKRKDQEEVVEAIKKRLLKPID